IPRPESAEESTAPEEQSVALPLNRIILSEQLQARGGEVSAAFIERYARAMESGSTFPPVRVAKVGEALYLVDGFHRYHATRQLGWEGIDAVVVECSWPQAKLEAARANLTHGIPLRNSEYRRVFRLFIEGGGNRTAKGRYRSYR